MSGKGSKPRPYSVPMTTYGDNFDGIFCKPSAPQPTQRPKKPTAAPKSSHLPARRGQSPISGEQGP